MLQFPASRIPVTSCKATIHLEFEEKTQPKCAISRAFQPRRIPQLPGNSCCRHLHLLLTSLSEPGVVTTCDRIVPGTDSRRLCRDGARRAVRLAAARTEAGYPRASLASASSSSLPAEKAPPGRALEAREASSSRMMCKTRRRTLPTASSAV